MPLLSLSLFGSPLCENEALDWLSEIFDQSGGQIVPTWYNNDNIQAVNLEGHQEQVSLWGTLEVLFDL